MKGQSDNFSGNEARGRARARAPQPPQQQQKNRPLHQLLYVGLLLYCDNKNAESSSLERHCLGCLFNDKLYTKNTNHLEQFA